MDAASFSPGEAFGRYVIQSKLGEGGMGVVYLAHDTRIARRVALKVLLPAPGGEAESAHWAEAKARLLREARAAGALTHAHIVTLFDAGEVDGVPFLAMEFIDGQTVRQLAAVDGGIPTERALTYLRAVGDALAAAHRRGIVHRDVKPDNVMVGVDGQVKVLDFGIARTVEATSSSPVDATGVALKTLTREGAVIGTVAYMAPEQVSGEVLDGRADQFAWGVMAYELLSGRSPWPVRSEPMVVLSAILAKDPPPLAEVAPHVPASLAAVVMRTLAKTRDARFPTMAAVLDALASVETAASPSAARSSTRIGDPTEVATLGEAPTEAIVVSALAQPPLGSAATQAPPARRRWLPGTVLVVAALAVPAAWFLRSHGAASTERVAALSASVSASASPTPTATRIVDLPPPKTESREALSEYKMGIQDLYDSNRGIAEEHFSSAVKADPALAAGHLRMSMAHLGGGDSTVRRAEYEKAAGLRGQLSDRDRGLLEALQPMLQGTGGDRGESNRRLEGLSARYPSDVEILTLLADGLRNDPPRALEVLARALSLDPQDAMAWDQRGDALKLMGRDDEALAAYEHCTTVSRAATDCVDDLAKLAALDGHCADFDRDARRAADQDPAYGWLVIEAMVTNGRSDAEIRGAVDQHFVALSKSSAVHPELLPALRALLEEQLPVVAGDFPLARSNASHFSVLLASSSVSNWFDARFEVAAALAEIARETGDEPSVRTVATRFVAESESWTQDRSISSVDKSLYLARLAYPRGSPAPASFEARRGSWIAERLARGAYKGLVWTHAYAATAFTAEEAHAALKALPRFRPLSTARGLAGIWDAKEGIPSADIGHVYLLAGQIDEAIPYLQKAVANCNWLQNQFVRMRAAVDLGHAFEQKRDTPAACDAYGKVIAQWGHAKPRSVTLEEARKRAVALSCR